MRPGTWKSPGRRGCLTAGWNLTESIIFLLLTAGLAPLMVTGPASVFLMLSTTATIALVAAGAGGSAVWFLWLLRRHGLRLRFAAAAVLGRAGGLLGWDPVVVRDNLRGAPGARPPCAAGGDDRERQDAHAHRRHDPPGGPGSGREAGG